MSGNGIAFPGLGLIPVNSGSIPAFASGAPCVPPLGAWSGMSAFVSGIPFHLPYVNEGPANGPLMTVPPSYFVQPRSPDTVFFSDGPGSSGGSTSGRGGDGPGGVGGGGDGGGGPKKPGVGGQAIELPRIERRDATTIEVYIPEDGRIGDIAKANVLINPSQQNLLHLFAAYVRTILNGDVDVFSTGLYNHSEYRNLIIHQDGREVKQGLGTLVKLYGQAVGLDAHKDIVARIRRDVAEFRSSATISTSVPSAAASAAQPLTGANLDGDIPTASEILRGMESRFADLREAIELRERAISALQAELRRRPTAGQLQKLREEKDALQQDLRGARRELNAIKAKMERLEARLTETKRQREVYRNRWQRAKRDIDGLGRELEILKERKEEVRKRNIELGALIRRYENAGGELERAAAKIVELERRVSGASGLLEDALSGPLAGLKELLSPALFGPDVIGKLDGSIDLVSRALAMLVEGAAPATGEPESAPRPAPAAPPIPEPVPARAPVPVPEPAAPPVEPREDTRPPMVREWHRLVGETILPQLLAGLVGQTRERMAEVLQEPLDDILSSYASRIDSLKPGTLHPPNSRRVLHGVIIEAVDSVRTGLKSYGIEWEPADSQLFRQLAQKYMIAFAAEHLPSKYQLAFVTHILRDAQASLGRAVSEAEAVEAPEEEKRPAILSAIDAFSKQLESWKSTFVEMESDDATRASMFGDLSSIGELLGEYRSHAEAGTADEGELEILMEALDELVKKSCAAEKMRDETAEARPAEALEEVEVVEEAPVAEGPAERADIGAIEASQQEEISENLLRDFPPFLTGLISSLSAVSKQHLHRIYLRKGYYEALKLLNVLNGIERRRAGITNIFFESLQSIFDGKKISSNRIYEMAVGIAKQAEYAARYGAVHEVIRVADLVAFGEPIADVGRQFMGNGDSSERGMSFNGWFLSGGRIVPRVLTQQIDSDAYSSETRTVYEIKSMVDGFGEREITVLSTVLSSPDSPVVIGDFDASHLLKFMNQIRKLGIAVQRNVIERVELHITTSVPLNPAVVEFIQRTIPLAGIFTYADLAVGRKDAAGVPENPGFHWVHAEPGARNRFALVGGPLRPFEHLASGPRPTPTSPPDAGKDKKVPAAPAAVGAADEVPLPPPAEIPKVDDEVEAAFSSALGMHLAADVLLSEETLPVRFRGAARELHNRLLERLSALRSELGDIARLTTRIRPHAKALQSRINSIRNIPDAIADRVAYIGEVVAIERDVAALAGLAHRWSVAKDAYANYSSKFSPDVSVPGPADVYEDVAALLVRLGNGDDDVGATIVKLADKLKALAQRVGELDRGAHQKRDFPARDLSDILVQARQIDTQIYFGSINTLRAKRTALEAPPKGFGDYKVFVAALEARLSALEAQISELESSGEAAWLTEYDLIEPILIAAWRLNDKLNWIGRSAIGNMGAERKSYVEGAIRDVSEVLGAPEIRSDDASELVERLQKLEEAATYADIIIQELEQDTSKAVAALSLAQRMLMGNLMKNDGLSLEQARAVIKAFVDDLNAGRVDGHSVKEVFDVPDDLSDADAVEGNIRGAFEAWKAANPAIFESSSADDAAEGDAPPWRTIDDKDARALIESVLAAFDSTARINWFTALAHFRNLHARGALQRMVDDLKGVKGEESAEWRKSASNFITEFMAPGRRNKPFGINRFASRLIDLAKRYLWIKRNANGQSDGGRTSGADIDRPRLADGRRRTFDDVERTFVGGVFGVTMPA